MSTCCHIKIDFVEPHYEVSVSVLPEKKCAAWEIPFLFFLLSCKLLHGQTQNLKPRTKKPLPWLILKSWKTSATIAAYLQHVHDCKSIVNPKAPVNKFRPCFFFLLLHIQGRFTVQCKSVFMASPLFINYSTKRQCAHFKNAPLYL